MASNNFYKITKRACEVNEFILGEHESGRKNFEVQFKFNVKGRGKSQKEKLQFADVMLPGSSKDAEIIIIDPEGYVNEI